MRLNNASIPSGAVYPDGVDITLANPDIQSSVRPEGSYFKRSVGYATIRPGRTRYQHNKGMGIHFTPMRFAENVEESNRLPLMVDSTVAVDHADIADLPGSSDLSMDGQLDPAAGPTYASEPMQKPGASLVVHEGTKTLPDMGDREPHRPLTQIFHGLAHPVQLFKGEYNKDPVIAIGGAALITAIAWSIGRDFERSYLTRERTASNSGGVSGATAPVAAAPSAAVDTSGNVVEQTADTAGAVVESVAEGAATVVETAGQVVEETTEAVADAVTGD